MQRFEEHHFWTDTRGPVPRLWIRSADVRGGGGTSLGEWKHNNNKSITYLNKEIPMIYCFNFCIFVQWPASIKLLVMFLFSLMFIKNTSCSKN